MTQPDMISVPREYHDSMVGGLHSLKSLGIDVREKAERLIERALAVSPPPAVVPLTAPSGGGLIPKLCLALVACLATGSVGAHSTREVPPVVKFPNRFANGFKLMEAGNWTKAAAEFASVSENGGPDHPAAMAREAECLFYKKEYTLAVRAANDLEAMQQSHPAAPYIRGLVFEAQGKKEKAAAEYQMAEFLGHPLAGERLAAVRR
jgi:tetratricopeptide (TPR) repeat protein